MSSENKKIPSKEGQRIKKDNSQQGSEVINNNHRQETINAPEENGTAQQKSKVIKTRYGQTVKTPDILSYT